MKVKEGWEDKDAKGAITANILPNQTLGGLVFNVWRPWGPLC